MDGTSLPRPRAPLATVRISSQQAITLSLNDLKSTDEGVTLENRLHRASFSPHGLTFTPRTTESGWRWRLSHVGTLSQPLAGVIIADVMPTATDSSVVSYRRGLIEERYVPGARHLEQQFVIPQRLDLGTEDLVIAGAIESPGDFETTEHGWLWRQGRQVVSLGDVTVLDARGVELPAEMEVTQEGTRITIAGSELARATYPVLVDPEIGTSDFRVSSMGPDGDVDFDAFEPAVAYNSTDNEYLVVWSGDDDFGTSVDETFEIYGQRIDAATGTELGSDFRISAMGSLDSDTDFGAFEPAIAYNSASNEYLVVWSGDDDTLGDDAFEIFGQRINAATGNPVGPVDFRISDMGLTDSDATFGAFEPAIAYNSASDNYLVVWQGDDDSQADDAFEIFGQVVDPLTGIGVGANDFRLSDMGTLPTDANLDALSPEIAYNSTENGYLVVWQGDHDSLPLIDEEFEIFGQRLSFSGAEVGPEFQISDQGPPVDDTYTAEEPAVAYNSLDNEYLVVWHGDDDTPTQEDDEFEIFGQRLLSNGTDIGANFRLSNMGPDQDHLFDAFQPAVAYNPQAEEYLVLWAGEDDAGSLVPNEFEIFGQRLDADGNEIGDDDFRLSDMGPDGSFDFGPPVLTISSVAAVAHDTTDNEYLVVWTSDDDTSPLVDDEFEIFGQRFAPPKGDLTITKDDGVTEVIAGDTVVYTLTVTNTAGSDAVTGARVEDTFPPELTSCSWDCTPTGLATCQTGTQTTDIDDLVDLPDGASVTYDITCEVDPAATGTVANTATVTAPLGFSETDLGNNSATDTDTLVSEGDLSIIKDDETTTAFPGETVVYTLTVNNAGPSDALGAVVTDTFPGILSQCAWTCETTGAATCNDGSGNLSDTIDVPADDSVVYTVTCNIDSAATGILSNTASVAPPVGFTDTEPLNDTDTDDNTLVPKGDLAITKDDGVTAASPGGTVTYTLVATNNGPSDVTGATVTDTFASELACTWSCVPAGGGSCTAGPVVGNIADTVNLPAGSSATYTATCTIAPSATGSLFNEATITAPGSFAETLPANNTASDTDTLNPMVDVAVTKSDGDTTSVPGGTVTYTINVSNSGPGNVTEATVVDNFATDLDCTWTCTTTGTATCNAAGTPGSIAGNISDTVSLPAGDTVTYTASCAIDPEATGSLINTATADATAPAGLIDTNPANDTATDTNTLTPEGNLSILKNDGQATAVPGSSVTYTIDVSNPGPSNVTGASVTDTFPTDLTCEWTCEADPGASCTAGPVAGDIGDSVSMPAGTSVVFSADCAIDKAASGSLINTASVTAPSGFNDPVGGNNSSTDTDILTPRGDLTITKDDGISSAAPGDVLDYTIEAGNLGPSDVAGASVTDIFPGAFDSCIWECAATGGAACAQGQIAADINDTVDIPVGETVTYTATCTVDSAAAGSLFNTATIAAPSGFTDPTPGNNSASDTTSLAAEGDLILTKDDGRTSAIPGNSVIYTITASNAGPSDVTAATVTDTFGSDLTCTWTCAPTGDAACNPGPVSGAINDTSVSLPAGSSVTYSANCAIDPSASVDLVNTASVTADAPAGYNDIDLGNNSASDIDTLTPEGDLTITKTNNRTTVVPGGTTIYSIVVGNSGPSTVSSAIVSDPFVSVLDCQWSCSPTGGATCAAGTMSGDLLDTISLPVGAFATYTATCTISQTASGDLINTATITPPAGFTESNPANNNATDSDTFSPEGDLAITKTNNQTATVPGTSVTYILQASNTGPSDVSGAIVQDNFPPELINTSWACSASSFNSSCPAGGQDDLNESVDIAAGDFLTYTVTGTVATGSSGNLINTASITGPANFIDPVALNNSATDTDNLTPVGELAITVDDGLVNAVPGTQVSYTVNVTNSGPSNVVGATVTDAFPTELIDVTWTCTPTAGSVCPTPTGSGDIAQLVEVVAGGRVVFEATGTLRPDAISSVISNTAQVTAPVGITDTNPANNTATDVTSLAPEGDLSITKTNGQTTVVPGAGFTYNITVSNAGPSDVFGALVEDTIPAEIIGATWFCSPASACSPALGSGNISTAVDIPAAGNVVIALEVTTDPDAEGVLQNTATITAPFGFTDLAGSNNSATDSDSLNPEGDLFVTKTDGQTVAVPGQTVQYILTIQNQGPSDADGALVTDLAPPEIVDISWTCLATGGSVCTASGPAEDELDIIETVDVSAGGSVTFIVDALIAPSATGSVSNTVTITPPAGFTDTNALNNSAMDEDSLGPLGDLAVFKDDFQTTVIPGTPVTYEILVTNAGPSDVVGATLTDVFPPELSNVTWSCIATAGSTCTAAGSGNLEEPVDILSAGNVTFTATGFLAPGASVPLANTATVTPPAGFTDPQGLNNSATDIDTLTPVGALSITKTDGQNFAVPGEELTYTLVASNAGPSDVVGATVSDDLPAGLFNLLWSCEPDPGSDCDPAGVGDVEASVDLLVGSSVTFTITGTIAPNLTGSLINTASISAPVGTLDPNTIDNSASDSTILTPVADLELTKTASPAGTVSPGTTLTYTLSVTNLGPSRATGVVVSDKLPPGVSLVNPLPPIGKIFADGFESNDTSAWEIGSGNQCAATDNIVSCRLGTLPSGETASATVEVMVDTLFSGTLTNVASVTADASDPDPDNNSSTVVTPVAVGPADVGISITASPNPVAVGGTLTYIVTVTNSGPAVATGVRAEVLLPPELVSPTVVAPGFDCGFSDNDVICDLEILNFGSAATIEIRAVVTPGPLAITTPASVNANQSDPNSTNNTDTVNTNIQ